MFNKKAQGEVITTVLIILLVLAAIVIVWQVVQSTVKSGAEQIEKQTDCIGINLDIEKATNETANNTIVRRNVGGPEKIKIYVFREGQNKVLGTSDVGVLDKTTLSINASPGNTIQAGAILTNGEYCNPVASATVVSP